MSEPHGLRWLRPPHRALPIDFSVPMVLAVLAGRKRCTRRIISSAAHEPWQGQRTRAGEALCRRRGDGPLMPLDVIPCRYGQPLSYLYMREPLRRHEKLTVYSATNEVVLVGGEPLPWRWQVNVLAARYCPKEASRVVLRNTGAVAERLHEVTEADAVGEGLEQDAAGLWLPGKSATARDAFAQLWESINDGEGRRWADNPAVYRVGLEELERRSAGALAK